MNTENVYRGTRKPTIKRIIDAHGELQPGQIITHEFLMDQLGKKVKDRNYYTLVSKWKRTVEDLHQDFIVENEQAIGYKVQLDSGKVHTAARNRRLAGRRINRMAECTQRVNVMNLTDDERRAHDWNNQTVAHWRSAQKIQPKKFTEIEE